MNSRLQQFLELENLTPARLADILGIQRSGLSHILSGRNKPGYDFILKLLTKFPSINAEWILTGKGKPYKELNAVSSPAGIQSGSQSYPNQPSNNIQYTNQPILGKSEENSGFETDWDANSLFSPVNTQSAESKKTQSISNNQSVTKDSTPTQTSENRINEMKPEIVRKERSVKRVIIFYSDGSFEELFPNK